MLDPDGSSDEDSTSIRQKIKNIRGSGAGVESPEFTSPFGSPRDEDGPLSAKGRFLELKRLMQDDLDSSFKSSHERKSRSTKRSTEKDFEDFEEVGAEWSREGSVSPSSYHEDVETLLQSFRTEHACERAEMSSSISQRLENNPKMIEVCQQLRERDMKIIGLESRVMELDRQVIDLQDTLSDRDKLLNSKNEAVNCMINQYQQDVIEKVSELSKTQETLFELEKKFGAAQFHWKTEKEKLNLEIKQQNTRLKDLEDTNKLLESARLELTSRDLELEDKLSVLKDDRNRLTLENSKIQSELDGEKEEKAALQQNLSRKTEEYEIVVEQLKGSLEKSTEQMTKLKQQFQAKLKSLKEQLKDNSAQAESQAQLTSSQNRVAELESELKDAAAKIEELQDKVIVLESQVEQLATTNQLDATSQNENQENETRLKNRIAELEEEKGNLLLVQEESLQFKNDKDKLEKDFLERLEVYEKNFEERMDEYENRIDEYEKQIQVKDKNVEDFEKQIQLKNKNVEDFEKKIEELTASLEKSSDQLTKMKRQFQAKLKALKEERKESSPEYEAQEKILTLENRIAELEEEKGNNLWLQEELGQIKMEKESLQQLFETKVTEYEIRIQGLENLLEKSNEQIQKLEHQEQKVVKLTESEGWASEEIEINDSEMEVSRTRIETLENQVAQLEEEKGSGFLVEEEISRMKSERETLEKSHQEKIAEYETKLEEVNAALNKSTETMTKMKRQFQAKLKSLREDRQQDSPTQSETEFQAKISSLENRVAELEEEKGNLLLQMVDYDEQQASRSSDSESQDTSSLQEQTIRLEISLAEKEDETRILQEQLNEMAAALSQKNVEVEQLMKNCSDMQQSLQQNIDELSGSVSAKEEEVRKVIQDYEEDHRLAHERIVQLEQQIMESSQQLIMKDSEAQDIIDKLKESENQLGEMSALVQHYQGLLEGSRNEDQGQLASLQQELELIKEKAAQAEKIFENMKTSYAEERNLQIKSFSDLQDELNKRTFELTVKDTACVELTQNTLDMQDRIDFLEREQMEIILKYQLEIEGLNAKIAICLSESDETDQIKLLQNDLNAQLVEKNVEIESLNFKLVELTKELSILNTQGVSLNSEKETLNTKMMEIIHEKDYLAQELQGLKHHYSSFEATYNQMYIDFNQKSQQLEEILQTGNQSNSLLKDLENQIAQKNVLLEETNTKLQLLDQEQSQASIRLEQVLEESESLKKRLSDLTADYNQLIENFDSKEVETQRLREDAKTLQFKYAENTNELKLKISTLMDQLNECENEISALSIRLKESDDGTVDLKQRLESVTITLEERTKLLEEKCKSLETIENSLFEKTEETLRLEERLREIEEKHKLILEENFVKYSDDLDVTYDQLASTANENVILQEKLKKYEKEIEDLTNQLNFISSQISNQESYSTDQMEKISHLENQLTFVTNQLEEVKRNENRESFRVVELERQLEEKQMRLQELSVELEEMKNLRINVSTVQSSMQQQSIDMLQDVQLTSNHAEELEERDRRIYELEVQLAELQISVDDANIQLAEVYELKTSINVLQCKLKEVEQENEKLRKELDVLKNERTRNLQRLLDMEAISGPRILQIPQAPTGQPVLVNEEIIRATAYTTTDTSLPKTVEEQIQQQGANQQTQYEMSLKEIKDLKVKNGKMIQRFKQLKDKYDAVVKDYESLKSKKDFSLDSAFEDEFLSQMKQKDKLLEEKGKQITELITENQRLTEKLDLLERGTDRLTEMKEEQDRTVQELVIQKRTLETEVSALKWKIEELENLSLKRAGSSMSGEQGSESNDYFNISTTDQAVQENSSLRQQNYTLSQELETLNLEIQTQKNTVDDLNERNQQLEEELEKLQEFQIEQHQVLEKRTTQTGLSQNFARFSDDAIDGQMDQQNAINFFQTPVVAIPSAFDSIIGGMPPQQFDSAVSITTLESISNVPPQPQSVIGANDTTIGTLEPKVFDNRIESLQQLLLSEQQEKVILEKKIELLQSKISEIEVSEIKCFEESLMLKSWTRQLELDNLKIQRELERIYNSVQDGDTGGLKMKVLQDEVLRLVDTLHDRDKRCEELTMEITRLLEERDTLQLKLSNVLRHNVSLHEEVNQGKEPPSGDIPSYDTEALKMKLAELEHMTYTMGIDLKREREARRLVQEQLFFSTSSRIYPIGTNRQSYSPSRTTPTPSPSPPSPGQGVVRPSTPQQQIQSSNSPSQFQPPLFQSTPQPYTPQQLVPVESEPGTVTSSNPPFTANI